MRLLELMRSHMFVSLAAAGAVLGIVVGLFLPIRAASPASGDALQWGLPTVQSIRRFDTSEYELLKTARFWSTDASGQGERRNSGWALRAIMTSPVAQAAILAQGATTQTWVRVGGSLPDGATLVALDRDTVWFDQEGCRRAKRLYVGEAGAVATGPGTDCIGQAPRLQAPPKAPSTSSKGPAISGPTQSKATDP